MNRFRLIVIAVLLACAWPAFAAPPATAADDKPAMPAWEQLTPAQRELLLAPVRERWNGNPGERGRMYEHAQRWRTMTPEQRQRAHRGMRRWSHMNPEQRDEARALFERSRSMTPQQRKALREQFKAMTPQQRKAWLEQNPPAKP
jgi:hypothetical protein